MRLSEAIRLGSIIVKEVRTSWFIPKGCYGCALGTGWYAATNGKQRWNHEGIRNFVPDVVINTFPEYPVEFLSEMSRLYSRGVVSRLQIADMVEEWEKENLPTTKEKEVELVEVEA